jgi:hypothetical protein
MQLTQQLYGIKPDFTGCGSQQQFYKKCYNRVKKAFDYTYGILLRKGGKPISGTIKTKIKTGKLPVNKYQMNPAIIRHMSPYLKEIIFNEMNQQVYGKNKTKTCSGIMNHEMTHTLAYSTGINLTEKETENINIYSLQRAGLHQEANQIRRISKYLAVA